MSRPRSKGSRDLPVGLYAKAKRGRVYYEYRHPISGRYHSVGQDRAEAIDLAIELNHALASQKRDQALARITNSRRAEPGRKFPDLARLYLARLDQRREDGELGIEVIRARRRYVSVAVESWERLNVSEIMVSHCHELIDSYARQGKIRSAKQARGTLVELFAHACAMGWRESNPAEPTQAPRIRSVGRDRLTLDQWRQVLEHAEQRAPWRACSMLLALVTTHAEESVLARLKFSDVRDGFLHIERAKNGSRVRIPLALRLNAVGLSLADALSRCRADGTVSPYLLHHTRGGGRWRAGDPISQNQLGYCFRKSRDAVGVAGTDGKRPPSFYEQRSLGARLYREQGYDPQILMGHKSAATTAKYLDPRGREYVQAPWSFGTVLGQGSGD